MLRPELERIKGWMSLQAYLEYGIDPLPNDKHDDRLDAQNAEWEAKWKEKCSGIHNCI